MTNNDAFKHLEEFVFSGRFEVEKVCDSTQGFLVKVRDYNDKFYEILWKNGVFAYRNSDESDRLQLISDLSVSNMLGSLILECENSTYIEWFVGERNGLRVNGLRHFIIVTSNDILDIIDFDLPIIKQVID